MPIDNQSVLSQCYILFCKGSTVLFTTFYCAQCSLIGTSLIMRRGRPTPPSSTNGKEKKSNLLRKEIMAYKQKEFKIYDFIFAIGKGDPQNKKYPIIFFHTRETRNLKAEDFFPYHEYKKCSGWPQNCKFFIVGLWEIDNNRNWDLSIVFV